MMKKNKTRHKCVFCDELVEEGTVHIKRAYADLADHVRDEYKLRVILCGPLPSIYGEDSLTVMPKAYDC